MNCRRPVKLNQRLGQSSFREYPNQKSLTGNLEGCRLSRDPVARRSRLASSDPGPVDIKSGSPTGQHNGRRKGDNRNNAAPGLKESDPPI